MLCLNLQEHEPHFVCLNPFQSVRLQSKQVIVSRFPKMFLDQRTTTALFRTRASFNWAIYQPLCSFHFRYKPAL